ncbi:PREDICTED: uncharacterized protein LOC105971934 isoform X2 [Erythranthe guttata]|uniref:uncharacterized protein LOC105971934 isoform X2 n=1 Tax=Erythranthe guttata TaxID=4155 RepID=UPI00064DDF42|nr:PREDICTED: uncharacterized protein LOC105971934 isoform X2 [Erythranthe guttata]|eukprot:XP_012852325.1 PREDICTED: uncharacterized protein LOC105971934 isoform X2 [Erythranthe guttata]
MYFSHFRMLKMCTHVTQACPNSNGLWCQVQYLPGWPLLAPVKVQMQKCEKCSQEFCSPINYRRHSRVHRRSLNINKECHKNRDLLAAFWDKLSVEMAKEVVSFADVMLKVVTWFLLLLYVIYLLA